MRTRYLEVNEVITNRNYKETIDYLSALKDGDIVDLSIVNEDSEDESFILTLLKKGSTYLALDNTYFGFEGAVYTLKEVIGLEVELEVGKEVYNIVSYK